jgi:hypothetical protein
LTELNAPTHMVENVSRSFEPLVRGGSPGFPVLLESSNPIDWWGGDMFIEEGTFLRLKVVELFAGSVSRGWTGTEESGHSNSRLGGHPVGYRQS